MDEKEREELLVSIDLVSKTATLAEISAAIGMEPDVNISHEIGQPLRKGKLWQQTIWRLGSGCPDTAPITDHMDALLRAFPFDALRDRSRLPADLLADLNIGVIQPYFCNTLVIPNDRIRKFVEFGMSLSVAVYAPIEEGEGCGSNGQGGLRAPEGSVDDQPAAGW